MAISVLQTASANTTVSGTACTATFGSGTSPGSCIVAAIAHFDASTLRSISSVKLGGAVDNFSQLTSVACTGSNIQGAAIWADPSAASGQTAVALTMSGLTPNITLVVLEVAGLAASSPLDVLSTNQASSGGSTWSSNATATTTQANELWVGMGSTFNQPVGPSSPWTNIEPASDATFGIAGYQIVSSTGTATYTGTQTLGTDPFAACVVALKAAPPFITLKPVNINQAVNRSAVW